MKVDSLATFAINILWIGSAACAPLSPTEAKVRTTSGMSLSDPEHVSAAHYGTSAHPNARSSDNDNDIRPRHMWQSFMPRPENPPPGANSSEGLEEAGLYRRSADSSLVRLRRIAEILGTRSEITPVWSEKAEDVYQESGLY